MDDDPLIREMTAAVERSPDVSELRLHLIELLIARRHYAEGVNHAATILSQRPAIPRP